MAISSRRIGAVVECPVCQAEVVVPDHDQLDLPAHQDVASVEPGEPTAAAKNPDVAKLPAQQFALPVAAEEDAFVAAPAMAARARVAAAVDEDENEDEGTDDEAVSDDTVHWIRRSQSPGADELDLTAMVDVVFQLLIFFMVTASFSLQKSMEVPTPDSPRKGVAQALQPLEDLQDVAILVVIDEANRVSVDDEPLGDLSALPDVLRDRMRKDQKSELILTASRQSLHRTVITVVDAANEVGMQRIRMAAAPAGEN